MKKTHRLLCVTMCICVGVLCSASFSEPDTQDTAPEQQGVPEWVEELCGDVRQQYEEKLPLWPPTQAEQQIDAIRQALLRYAPAEVSEARIAELTEALLELVPTLQQVAGAEEYTAAQARVLAFMIQMYFERGQLTGVQQDEIESQIQHFGELLERELLKLREHCMQLLREKGSSAQLPRELVEEKREKFENRLLSTARQPLFFALKRPLSPPELQRGEDRLQQTAQRIREEPYLAENLVQHPEAAFGRLLWQLANTLKVTIIYQTEPQYPERLQEAIEEGTTAYAKWIEGHAELQRIQGTMLFWDQALLLHNCLRGAQPAWESAEE